MSLYDFAKFQFECGNYAKCAEYLFHCRALFPTMSLDRDKTISAIWGSGSGRMVAPQPPSRDGRPVPHTKRSYTGSQRARCEQSQRGVSETGGTRCS